MSDYERIARAITFINARVSEQPSLAQIASHLNMSPYHFQRMFSRWAGVTPKKYLQILTVEHARKLLSEPRSLQDVADTVGLSSSSRLYDHFVQLEAMTPGEYRQQGRNLDIQYATHQTRFGEIFIATTPRGICRLSFLDHSSLDDELQSLTTRWPNATFCSDASATADTIEAVFSDNTEIDSPLSLHVCGTNFQVNVWRALLQIPPGTVASYQQVASTIHRPDSARAVGHAIGANPVAFIIPCHRVIQKNGQLGGYHWGLTRKHALHAWEYARHASHDSLDDTHEIK